MVASFLTDEWFAEALAASAALEAVDAVDATVQWVVSGAPGGKVSCFVAVRDGKVTELAAGKRADASCTVQCSAAVARALLDGSLSSDVAFMRGDLKIDGDYAAYVLRLDALTRAPGAGDARRRLLDATSF